MVPRNLKFQFTLVSYNILSQTLLHNHGYLYGTCNPRDLEWPRRGHRIVSELLRNEADIICLQEVESEHLTTLYKPRLARSGYECLYKKKTGYKVDGCAIFFKSKLFHLLSHKCVEFNRTDLNHLLNRDNVGIIAVLRPKFRGQVESKLVVANTHLIFNPKRSDVKLAQMKYFLSELEDVSFETVDEVANKRLHHATILCGDLNSVPESDVKKFITKNLDGPKTQNDASSDKRSSAGGSEDTITTQAKDTLVNQICDPPEELRDETLNNLNHSFKFKSVYPSHNRNGRPYVSTFSKCIVDYIFYTPKLRLESYKELLTEEELLDSGPIPNSEFPSDHLTLEARFTM